MLGMEESTFPKYYEMDSDIIIRVDSDGEKVTAITSAGKPYPPFKALMDGWKSSEEAFKKQAQSSSPSSLAA